MTSTAEPIEIVWTGAHLVGTFVVSCLIYILWLRRRAVVFEDKPLTPKEPRIRSANRQMRDRSAWCAFHAICVVLGLLRMSNVFWLSGVIGWLFIVCSVALVFVALFDLFEETRSR